MRVRNSSDPDLFASCEAVDYGETEDYGINIIETIRFIILFLILLHTLDMKEMLI